jgi:hypothetical protein
LSEDTSIDIAEAAFEAWAQITEAGPASRIDENRIAAMSASNVTRWPRQSAATAQSLATNGDGVAEALLRAEAAQTDLDALVGRRMADLKPGASGAPLRS